MKYFAILFLILFSGQLLAKDFNLKEFTPVQVKDQPAENDQSKEVVDLQLQINNLMERIKVLEDKVENLTIKDSTPISKPIVKAPVEPVKFVKSITFYSIPGCVPCLQWKNDVNGVYKKAFEKDGFTIIEGNPNTLSGVSFPFFEITYGNKKGNFQGLITLDFVKNKFK